VGQFEHDTEWNVEHVEVNPGTPWALLQGGFVVVAGYLMLGMAYMHFVQGQSGIRMIPNLEFWTSAGGAVVAALTMLFFLWVVFAGWTAGTLRTPVGWAEKFTHDTEWNIAHAADDRGASLNLLTGLGWVALLYFGVGGLLNFLAGYRGAEIVPNLAFWIAYPALVADGIYVTRQLLLGESRAAKGMANASHETFSTF